MMLRFYMWVMGWSGQLTHGHGVNIRLSGKIVSDSRVWFSNAIVWHELALIGALIVWYVINKYVVKKDDDNEMGIKNLYILNQPDH